MSEHPDEAAMAHAIEALSQELQPRLRGLPPEVQGGALFDLTAIWLAGHIVPGDRAATAEMRRAILEAHLAAIWPLVEFHHRRMFGN